MSRILRTVSALVVVSFLALGLGGSTAKATDAVTLPAGSANSTTGLISRPGSSDWLWPVTPHRIVRGFEQPETKYSAGHRGIDLAVEVGDPVHSPATGTASFVGQVAGQQIVVIDLGGSGGDDNDETSRLRITLLPVLPNVSEGDPVAAGQIVGTALAGHGAGIEGCSAACLHFGVRIGDTYVSPLLWYRGDFAVLKPFWGDGED